MAADALNARAQEAAVHIAQTISVIVVAPGACGDADTYACTGGQWGTWAVLNLAPSRVGVAETAASLAHEAWHWFWRAGGLRLRIEDDSFLAWELLAKWAVRSRWG